MTAAPSRSDPALARLRQRLGAPHVLTGEADLAPHLREERGLYRGHAVALVRPADTAEVSWTLAVAREFGLPVVPQGGNTGLVGGGVPFGGLVLSLARLDRVRAFDPVNATITVEAGRTLAAVREQAAAAGLLFPLSLPSEGSARIGGNLATNAGGSAVLRYGNARELTLGLEVVLADGRVWNGLGALRKDNTGYDLKHLFIGSEGTLGIITAAVLKLFPAPRSRATAFAGLASPHAALRLFERLRAEAGDALTAFEYLPRFALDLVLRHGPDPQDPLPSPHACYALVELASPTTGGGLDAILEGVLAAAIEDGTIEDATAASSDRQRDRLWALREGLSPAQTREGGSVKHDVAVPVSAVATFIEAATRACEAARPGVRVCAFGHFGDGSIHFNVSQPVGADRAAFLGEWAVYNRIVHDIAHGMGGTISAEHGIGLVKRDELVGYKDPVALATMKAVKAALDPTNILNPGKLVAIGDELPDPLPHGR